MLHNHLQVRIQGLSCLDFVVESQDFVVDHVSNYQSLRLRNKEMEVVVRGGEAVPREADKAGHLRYVQLPLNALLVLSQKSYVFVDVLTEMSFGKLDGCLDVLAQQSNKL